MPADVARLKPPLTASAAAAPMAVNAAATISALFARPAPMISATLLSFSPKLAVSLPASSALPPMLSSAAVVPFSSVVHLFRAVSAFATLMRYSSASSLFSPNSAFASSSISLSSFTFSACFSCCSCRAFCFAVRASMLSVLLPNAVCVAAISAFITRRLLAMLFRLCLYVVSPSMPILVLSSRDLDLPAMLHRPYICIMQKAPVWALSDCVVNSTASEYNRGARGPLRPHPAALWVLLPCCAASRGEA